MRLIIFLMLVPSVIFAESYSDVIKGTVEDERGFPIQEKILFTDTEGNEFIITSDANGEYSGAIDEGKTYTISIAGYKVNEKSSSVTTNSNNTFDEFKHIIVAQELKSGVYLFEDNLFDSNSPALSKDAKKIIKKIREMMFEHKIKVLVKINATDIKANKAETLEKRKKALLMELFKYNLANNSVFVEIDESSKPDSNAVFEVK
jgi:DNA-binding GntR family transcriptional regulator